MIMNDIMYLICEMCKLWIVLKLWDWHSNVYYCTLLFYYIPIKLIGQYYTYSDSVGGLFNAKKIQFVKIVINIISSNILWDRQGM